MDVNIIWISRGRQVQRPLNIDIASEIFESEDITTMEFGEEVMKEKPGNFEIHEHMLINADTKFIEMDGDALRYDWFSIKQKLLKLRQAGWRIVQLDPEVIQDYPWLKMEMPKKSMGKGWHGDNKRHSVTNKIGRIKKKYKTQNQNITDEEEMEDDY